MAEGVRMHIFLYSSKLRLILDYSEYHHPGKFATSAVEEKGVFRF